MSHQSKTENKQKDSAIFVLIKMFGAFLNIPGTLISELTNLVFGNTKLAGRIKEYKKAYKNHVSTTINGKPPSYFEQFRALGLLGLISQLTASTLSVVRRFALMVSKFLVENQHAINRIIWLALTAALVITVVTIIFALVWPVSFASVVSFSIGGISIGAIAGANLIAQIAVTCVLAATLSATLTALANIAVKLIATIPAALRKSTFIDIKTSEETKTNHLDSNKVQIEKNETDVNHFKTVFCHPLSSSRGLSAGSTNPTMPELKSRASARTFT